MTPRFFRFTISLALASGIAAAFTPDDVTTRNFFGEGVTFDRPLLFTQIPGQDSAYLVVQQLGAVILMQRDAGSWARSTFDSVSVGISNPYSNNDAGLLGFTFHPDYRNNGKYYLLYIEDHAISPYPGTIILRERVADTSLLGASGDSGRVLLRIEKEYPWHIGGTIHFGPEGALYIGLGDGGGMDDPSRLARVPGSLHGKFLRIDVDGEDAFPDDPDRNYEIPAGNPFVDDEQYLPEIWAVGLRNPWKWTFHPVTGEIWAGDVGQGLREKITVVPKGGDLGWSMWEGTWCFREPCDWSGITLPVLDLGRGESVSVTGGVFFEGEPHSVFHGAYIFGDFGTNHVWALQLDPAGEPLERVRIASVEGVASFDKDSAGNIFAVSIWAGRNWTNTGTVQILESPELVPSTLRQAPRRQHEAPSSISRAELLRNRDRYILRGVDGRRIEGTPTGTFILQEKDRSNPPRLIHAITEGI